MTASNFCLSFHSLLCLKKSSLTIYSCNSSIRFSVFFGNHVYFPKCSGIVWQNCKKRGNRTSFKCYSYVLHCCKKTHKIDLNYHLFSAEPPSLTNWVTTCVQQDQEKTHQLAILYAPYTHSQRSPSPSRCQTPYHKWELFFVQNQKKVNK